MKTAAPANNLLIAKLAAQRASAEKRRQTRTRRGQDARGEKVTGQFFRQVVARPTSLGASGIQGPTRPANARRAGDISRTRLLRVYFKIGRRNVRRFHNRFSVVQILRFYIGIPALVSLALCVLLLQVKPPPGVPSRAVEQRVPPAVELVQKIQSGLSVRDIVSVKAALAELEKFYPNDPRTFVARGTSLAHEKNYDEARKSYLRALELSSGLPSALINLGEIEFATGHYAKAAGYYEQAARRLPRNSLILFRRYLCYSLLNERSTAEAVARELSSQPNSVEWYFIQASEALHSGNKPEAQRLVTTARTLFGERAAAYQESLRKIGWMK